MTEGPFAGWTTWGNGADPYETLIGPFFFKIDDKGEALCAFEPRAEHRNGGGFIHGGLLMSFADFALFSFAYRALGDVKAVTLTCNSEFMSAGVIEDGVIEARGEVLRETRSLLFVRGLMTQRGRGVLAFSGALKKIGA